MGPDLTNRPPRPDWIKDRSGDPPGALHGLYMEDLKGTTIYHENGQCGRIAYLWLGMHNWPVTFRVETVPGGVVFDWNYSRVRKLDYNVPWPTAEQIYEYLRTRS